MSGEVGKENKVEKTGRFHVYFGHPKIFVLH
jgi:hypothetical protein